MPPITQDLTRVAIHEVGHALAATAANVPVFGISLQEDETSLGRIHCPPPPTNSMEQCRSALTYYAAGRAAEHVYDPSTPPTVIDSDSDEAYRVGRKMHGLHPDSIELIEAEIAAAQERAIQLVRANWAGAMELAKAIVQVHRVARRFNIEPVKVRSWRLEQLAAAKDRSPAPGGQTQKNLTGPSEGGTPCGGEKAPDSDT